jgi:hypothetical protein
VNVARGPAQRFEVLGQLVSSTMDLNPSMATHLKPGLWKRCVAALLDMVQLLADNPNIKVCVGGGGNAGREPSGREGRQAAVFTGQR